MSKKKSSEADLQRLCGSKGPITILQKGINLLLGESKEKDHFKILLNLIILVTLFQDKNMKKLTKIKEGLKTENPELFAKFGRFYASIKTCGRDNYKSTKHHSFVSNQARLRKLKIGKTIHYSPTDFNIYLSSEFNREAMSLGHFKQLKSKGSLGEFHDLMMEDIVHETKKFIKAHGKSLCEPLF